MPRKARIDAPGALQHIIIRGIERNAVFKDSQDHKNFIERLGNVLTDSSTPCYAWTLMTNHIHLLLRTGMVPLATVMRRLLTGYAQQFNRRYGRHGHLFQNRYKSFLCEEDPYLLELVRYIHLNPIRGGVVNDLKALNSYPYSGHSVLMGKVKHGWQNTDYVLRMFGKAVHGARKSYLRFVSEGIAIGRRPELVGGGLIRSVGGWSALKAIRSTHLRVMGDERILGSGDFVESVLERANEAYDRKTLAMRKGRNLDTLINAVADHFRIDGDTLTQASKQRPFCRVRSIICCLAVDRLALSGAEVARKLNLSPSAVSKLLARGRKDSLAKETEDIVFGSNCLRKAQRRSHEVRR